MSAIPSLDDLLLLGRSSGLDVVGVAPAVRFSETCTTLEYRRSAGLHGGMAFTYRNPERSTDPARSLPDAATLIVGATAYRHAQPPAPAGSGPQGRVARYASARHDAPLRAGLGAVADALRSAGFRARLLVDDNALVDREAARRAGIGFYGKNSNLLIHDHGSWFLLGSVLTDAPLSVDRCVEPTPADGTDGCGSCTRCIEHCPTAAIVAPGVVDARRCLSWLLQQRGTFPRAYRRALGDRIYGCDDCQEVCPPNRSAAPDPHPDTVAGGDGPGAWVPLLDLLGATDDELMKRIGRWYVADRDPAVVRRNALVALGNIGDGADDATVAAIRAALHHPVGQVRAHAVWAAQRLGLLHLLADVSADPDPCVQDELAAVADHRLRVGQT